MSEITGFDALRRKQRDVEEDERVLAIPRECSGQKTTGTNRFNKCGARAAMATPEGSRCWKHPPADITTVTDWLADLPKHPYAAWRRLREAGQCTTCRRPAPGSRDHEECIELVKRIGSRGRNAS